MDWQQTAFFTIVFLVVAFLLVSYVIRTRRQERELEKARSKPDPAEEIRVLIHELKNAKTLTDTMTEMIREKGFNEKRFRLLVEGLARMGEVMEIAGGRTSGVRRPLADVVAEALEFMNAFPDVEVEFSPCAGTVLATPELKSALVNLFKNAAESMADSPVKKLLVDMRVQGRHLFLIVKDTGCGIPPEDREKIWEQGFTTKETGSGVGMGVIRRGVRSADGNLVLLNSEPGSGTEFVFAFRMRSPIEEGGPPSTIPPASAPPASS